MTDEIQKQPQEIQKSEEFNPVKIKKWFKENIRTDKDPLQILHNFDKLRSQLQKAPEKEANALMSKFEDEVRNMLTIVGIDNHYPLSGSVIKSYQPLIIQVADDFIQEYGCKNASEKVLAELMASAYVRIINYSRRMAHTTDLDHTTKELNNFLAIMSKEVDRAQRQFITAVSTLKQLKAPNFEVNVKAKTAFISQNQQINATQKDNDNQQYENIKP